MPKLLRNVLAIIAGIIIASMVNMALITFGSPLIPPPAGVDVKQAESIRNALQFFEPKHFIIPFLSHALGTLAGAIAAYLLAATYKPRFAYVIGVVYLCGGIAASFMIPAPAWFITLDLLAAYLPMAWLAVMLGRRMQPGV